MLALTILEGARQGERLPLPRSRSRIGRDADAEVCLVSASVSRNHALILATPEGTFLEDLGSRNGTLLNGTRIEGRVLIKPNDRITIGDFALGLTLAPSSESAAAVSQIREQVRATLENQALFAQNAAQKLQIVLEITRLLSETPDLKPMLDRLLERLMQLFPRADRGLILLSERGELVVRAQLCRRAGIDADFPFSRTIVKKSFDDGVGILSDDLGADARFQGAESIRASKMRSMICVPLIARNQRPLGVVQLDQTGSGLPFGGEDLRLLTTIGLQVAVTLDSAAAAAERIRNEAVRKELAIARDMQLAYLPTDFAPRPGFDLFASLVPARDFSGDLYDFFSMPDGRLAFFVGDVSGKGLPAAIFMVAVRTLARHLAPDCGDPADALARLNEAVSRDNPSMLFVTLIYGIFDPAAGTLECAAAGHPPPLLLKPDGRSREIDMPSGQVLGYSLGRFAASNVRIALDPGDALVFYSDGITEAFAPEGGPMFGVEGLRTAAASVAGKPLAEMSQRILDSVRQFAAPARPRTTRRCFCCAGGECFVADAIRISIDSVLADIDVAVERALAFAESIGLPAETGNEIALVLEEVLTNIIRHGHRLEAGHPIAVALTALPEELAIVVEDTAPPFDLFAAPAADIRSPMSERRPGGLGIHLVRRIMNAGGEYVRTEGKNRLTLRKRRT